MPIRERPAEQVAQERQLRDTRLNLCVTSTQAAFIRRAAESNKKSLTEFVLESAATAAERPVVLKPRLQVLLGEPDRFID